MAGGRNIVQYRERLDRTLASRDLVDGKLLAALVKDQVLRSPRQETQWHMEKLLEARTQEVSNFIDMLRSVSGKGVPKGHGKQQNEWKLKRDSEDCRIMYREGPPGTPFHTLLVEGYVDAPVDVCLCVSWESALYKKWWPQLSIPTFKILSCKCLHNVHINEQISLIRAKLSWPLSTREGIVHFFEFEYIQGDLVIVLMNSIPDLEAIGGNFCEANDDGMAEENEVVKIDIVGGFALQKVTPERSYFRTIANLDVKLDFVPPWFINFLSRQIIGNGFKLYRKAVASVYKGDGDFSRALESSLYARVRGALYVSNIPKETLEPEDLNNDVAQIFPKEYPTDSTQADVKKEDYSVLGDHCASKSPPGSAPVMDQEASGETRQEKDDSLILSEESLRETSETDVIGHNTCTEIEEEEIEQGIQNEEVSRTCVNNNRKVSVRPEVEQALETLETVILLVQKHELGPQTTFTAPLSSVDLHVAQNDTTFSEGIVSSTAETRIEASNNKPSKKASSSEPGNSSGIHLPSDTGANGHAGEVHHGRIAPPSSPKQKLPLLRKIPSPRSS